MESISEQLHLKTHLTGRKSNSRLISGPGDVEVHKGRDGRYYIVDCARLLPPEDPSYRGINDKRIVFYDHLRPEFVRKSSVPLNSDALTMWHAGTEEERQNDNEDVRNATKRLFEEVIPAYAKELDTRAANFPWEKLEKNKDDLDLIRTFITEEEIHAKGINLRHLVLTSSLFFSLFFFSPFR
jgi:hypothetical protein